MLLSQKSLNFAKLVLKYNPISQRHQHTHSSQQDNQASCSHHPQQQIKPYLHVHDHRKQRQIYQKPINEKLECMRNFKQQGNQHFKSKRYQQAAHYYNKVIIFADYTFPEHEKQQKEMDELLQQANCNLGMSLVKMGQNKKAIQNFIESSKGPSEKVIIKSLYWLVKCHLQQGQFDKASINLDKLTIFGDKTDSQTSELNIQLKKAVELYEKKSKGVFGQMFGKTADSVK